VSGMVVAMRVMKNKRGENFAFLTLDDKSGRLEVSVFAEKYNIYRDILVKDALLVVQGGISEDSFSGGLKMLADSIQSIYDARCSKLKRLELAINTEPGNVAWVEQLRSALEQYKDGNCALELDYTIPSSKGRLKLGNSWRVQPKDELIGRLRQEFGKNSLTLHYD